MDKLISKFEIRNILKPIESLCSQNEGMSRAISYLLNENSIENEIKVGSIHFLNYHVPIQFWVECQDCIIDYRLNHWLGPNSKLPLDPIFKPAQFPELIYSGGRSYMDVNRAIFDILTNR